MSRWPVIFSMNLDYFTLTCSAWSCTEACISKLTLLLDYQLNQTPEERETGNSTGMLFSTHGKTVQETFRHVHSFDFSSLFWHLLLKDENSNINQPSLYLKAVNLLIMLSFIDWHRVTIVSLPFYTKERNFLSEDAYHFFKGSVLHCTITCNHEVLFLSLNTTPASTQSLLFPNNY